MRKTSNGATIYEKSDLLSKIERTNQCSFYEKTIKFDGKYSDLFEQLRNLLPSEYWQIELQSRNSNEYEFLFIFQPFMKTDVVQNKSQFLDWIIGELK